MHERIVCHFFYAAALAVTTNPALSLAVYRSMDGVLIVNAPLHIAGAADARMFNRCLSAAT